MTMGTSLADELMDLLEVSQGTRTLVGKGRTNRDRFVLLTCSSEFMERNMLSRRLFCNHQAPPLL